MGNAHIPGPSNNGSNMVYYLKDRRMSVQIKRLRWWAMMVIFFTKGAFKFTHDTCTDKMRVFWGHTRDIYIVIFTIVATCFIIMMFVVMYSFL